MNDALQYFLISWTDPKLLMMAAIGTFAGIYIGAIPGLSVTMAVSILISFTFKWPVNEALVLIAGIYLGGVYGGSRASILLNIPGGPAQIATSLDGYPIAKRGEAGLAIGLTTVVSVIGGFIAIAVLAIAAPVVSEFALTFGPREYLLLAAWGLLLVGSLVLANIFLLIFGLSGIKLFAKVVETPKRILLPIILVLSVVGAYSINNNPMDVYWMLGFGVLGYFLKIYGFQVGPVILGMVLGPLMDRSYRQAMLSAGENPGEFLMGFVTSPLSAGIALALLFTIVSQTQWWKRRRSGHRPLPA
ncbi:TctA family transporter [Kerstersia gyiorum]|uniref:tripartite tricarboxylate transporter permease n=1 Tax=Kerstersia gyiorum TaxID=206506 RepID=UPI00209CD0E7|nr:tripartite tricarboxylate transporter permease [Kerstersia gyiorum]MCP1711994.1 TctA family transporter [Kerstersia gyiorum]